VEKLDLENPLRYLNSFGMLQKQALGNSELLKLKKVKTDMS
jgi:hypothetical protein